MRCIMSLVNQQAEFALNVSKLINYIFENEHRCTFGEAWRSVEQAAIYAKAGKGIKNSLHCSRMAIDLNLFNMNGNYLTKFSDYEKFGVYWEGLHHMNRWGGRFKKLVDCVHFQMDIK